MHCSGPACKKIIVDRVSGTVAERTWINPDQGDFACRGYFVVWRLERLGRPSRFD